MKARPACLPCVLLQTLRLTTDASEDAWSQRKVLNEAMRVLLDTNWSERPPADIVGDAVAQTRLTLKVADPFAARRAEVHKAFEPIAQDLEQRLAQADDPLALATVAAAAANVVDALILVPTLDCAKAFRDHLDRGFQVGDPTVLTGSLEGVKEILYLLDNAGEILVDAILIRLLRDRGIHVRCVIRSPGLLHDGTLDDAVAAGLAKVIEVEIPVEEAEAPPPEPAEGAEPPTVIELPVGVHGTPAVAGSKAIKEAVARADLVIAKGPANLETFATEHPVIHLLRVKCDPVARHLGAHIGDLVIKRIPRST